MEVRVLLPAPLEYKMITNSLEWNKVETTLRRQAKGLTHSRDIIRMIDNVGPEIKQLSIAEIQARRGRKILAEEILAKINQDIEMVEEYILVAALLG